MQDVRRRHRVFRVHLFRRSYPRCGEECQQVTLHRVGAAVRCPDLRQRRRADGRGGAVCRALQPRHHRHQLRLSGEESRLEGRRVWHHERHPEDGGHHRGGGESREQTRDGEDTSRLRQRTQRHSGDCGEAAGCRHPRADDTRPSAHHEMGASPPTGRSSAR